MKLRVAYNQPMVVVRQFTGINGVIKQCDIIFLMEAYKNGKNVVLNLETRDGAKMAASFCHYKRIRTRHDVRDAVGQIVVPYKPNTRYFILKPESAPISSR